MRPAPYLFVPNLFQSHRAIRALHAAGYSYRDKDVNWFLGLVSDDDRCVRYPYLAYEAGNLGLWDMNSLILHRGTLCNSPRHMISYLRRPS